MDNQVLFLTASLAVFGSLALNGVVSTGFAQQDAALLPHNAASSPAPETQNPMDTAVALNMRRSKLYQNQDLVGAASLYTEDATYVELMPVLHVFKRRDQIRGHFEELVSAYTVNIVPTVLTADRSVDGTILVSGDYLVFLREDTEVAGHFIQTLRQEDGTWRIAMHAFARTEPVTAAEIAGYGRD